MKRDWIYAPTMLGIAILLFLFRATGLAVHVAVSVIGLMVLAVYTAATKKEWKAPVFEIIMRACYGIAIVTGPLVIKFKDIVALNIAHKASAALFVVLLIVLFIYKMSVNKKVSK